MLKFFEALPFNTARAFTMATTYNGCEIYVPCWGRSSRHIRAVRKELERALSLQTPTQPPVPPAIA